MEGNIGAGKTTFCNWLNEQVECRLILEQFDDNPFLPLFYQDPERNAFPVELFFMTERHKQLQAWNPQPDLFGSLTVADYLFIKTLLFARNNLKDAEWHLFQRIFHALHAQLPKPDIIVYFHHPVDQLLKHIGQRGRNYEQWITPEYLFQIQQQYIQFLYSVEDRPVLFIDFSGKNTLDEEWQLSEIYDLLQEQHTFGVNTIRLS